jgi:hypothetical protein
MKISSKGFRVREGHEVNLRKWPTTIAPVYKSKEHYQKLLGEHVAQLSSQQELLYASNRYAVLLIFQLVALRHSSYAFMYCFQNFLSSISARPNFQFFSGTSMR